MRAPAVPTRRRRPDLRVVVTDARGRPAQAPGLARWLASAAPAGVRGAVGIAVVGDARMRRLNLRYRGADYATDVLAFAVEPPPPARRSPSGPRGRFLGDIVIALGVARRQARARGHTLAVELRVLALHGLLHLLGYDHETDRGEMLRTEDRLRRRAGLPGGLIARSPGRTGRR